MRIASFWFWHAVVPSLLFLELAIMFEVSYLDLWLASYHFDFINERWRCYTCWWSNALLHTGGRLLTGSAWLYFFSVWLISFRYTALVFLRRAYGYVWVAMICAGGCVTLLKRITNVDCPWALGLFDGTYPYVRLLEDRPDYLPMSECFPSAHAAAGFAFLSLYFLWRDYHRFRAFTGLGIGLLLGFLYGYGQQARGAHFVSHDIWAAAVCWFVCLFVYQCIFKGRLWSSIHRQNESI